MKIQLAIECDREMFFFDRKTAEIYPVKSVRESISGDTIETIDGQIIRTCSKNHAVFNIYSFARLAQKEARNQFDAEYDQILKEQKLIRIRK